MTARGPGLLYVVATPIGNLEDITLRALRVLGECDGVIAEDTRRTRQLLTAHGLGRPLHSLPAHDEQRRVPALLDRLLAGEVLALCSDAGTPVVSDPGAALVRGARDAGIAVVPIPGASALTAALSGSGLRGDRVCFLGFLPRSPGKLRRTVEAGLAFDGTLVFYESTLRLARTLARITPVCGDRPVVVARELTKVHETFHTGTAATLADAFAAHPPRGECTVLIGAS
ncbi:MAG: 16S rRNA (cytidine(1402)-2'-O)-methyltransferase [Candidatus Dormibacteraeota bacterium]|uniref:Ribosomal RNA small subunit methyltransferase I n=1 Tax=Candidatus Amunia macphersoniae TaxID=3127014 RepID=A0A934NH77_9BACT|nr:16S rRNA (cytidine(1402)-2'-O)-methyltransferase [Candidatus Dormibacteraeota bacterium]